MRRRLGLGTVTLVAGLLLVGGCGASGQGSDADRSVTIPGGPSSPTTPTTTPTGPSSTDPSSPPSDDAGDDTTCRQVRAGIDAFNTGDYDGTVLHFKLAVPLAQRAQRRSDSRAAQDLLDAVRYYAALAPGDYLGASVSSPDFAKYKAITLGQCETGGSDRGGDGGGGVTI